MPKRPAKPCPGAGKYKGRCANLIRTGNPVCNRCLPYHIEATREKAREHNRGYDKGRPSPDQRGYDTHWRKLRKMVLAREPLCRRCGEAGRTEPATLIHHIDEDVSNNYIENLEPLCSTCHNRIHGWRG